MGNCKIKTPNPEFWKSFDSAAVSVRRTSSLRPTGSPLLTLWALATQWGAVSFFLTETEILKKFRVLGAHANRNFFNIEVEMNDGLRAFGVAALMLKETDEDGEAEFFAAIPAGTPLDLPGDGVVTLETVLDPEQADVFGIQYSQPKVLHAESITKAI